MKLFFITIILLLSIASFGQTITSDTTSDKITVKPGEIATFTTTLKNTSVVRTFILTATGYYTDNEGVRRDAIPAETIVTCYTPATVSRVVVPIPDAMIYVADSAKIDSAFAPVTVTTSMLNIFLNKILCDQDTCLITYRFQAK